MKMEIILFENKSFFKMETISLKENSGFLISTVSRYKLSTTCCISRICETLSTIEEDTDEDKEIIEEGAEINYRDQTRVDIDGRLPGVIFVLEKASLEVAKVGKVFARGFTCIIFSELIIVKNIVSEPFILCQYI